MRQIVLDTETTGLSAEQGHRIIEIGAVEMIHRRVTGNSFHQYLKPDRAVDPGAFAVHGISNEFLADKPHFADIAADLIEFIKDAELIIHNAPFDLGFLNSEFQKLEGERTSITQLCKIIDTLVLARKLHPGQKNNLDALCKRYAIDNSQREKHGALLDAEILADVFLAMTGGQVTLTLDGPKTGSTQQAALRKKNLDAKKLSALRVIPASDEEQALHQQTLSKLDKSSKGQCLWLKL